MNVRPNNYSLTFKYSPILSVLAGVLVFTVMANEASDFNPQIDGFGNNWQSYSQAEFNGNVVKGKPYQIAEVGKLWNSKGFSINLLLGASQLHTISNANDIQRIAVYHANRSAINREAKERYLQLSYGNANLYELLGAYLSLRENGFVPNRVIVGLTYDDLREEGVRGEIALDLNAGVSLNNQDEGMVNLLKEISKTKASHNSLKPMEKKLAILSPQARLEIQLVKALEEYWPGFQYRDRLQGMIEIFGKELLAKLILGSERNNSISVQHHQEQYQLKALDTLRRIVEYDNSSLRVYRAPLLKKKTYSYYNKKDYDAFSLILKSYCDEHDLIFKDFENLVPNKHFGLTNSGLPDYFHFAGRGHEILGSALDDWIASIEK